LGISGKHSFASPKREVFASAVPSEGNTTTEGFLFPATYQFVKKDVTPDAVITKLLDQFAIEAQGLHLKEGAARLGLTPYQLGDRGFDDREGSEAREGSSPDRRGDLHRLRWA